MDGNLISADDTFALLAMFAGISWLALKVEKTKVGSRISGVVVAIFTAAILSQIGVIPKSAPLYGDIWTYGVPLAIALFLFRADLVSIYREGGRILLAFAFGVAGSALGAFFGAKVLNVGPFEAELAAVLSATYTGGSLNLAAVAEAIGFNDGTQVTAAVAADNVLGTLLLVATIFVAKTSIFHAHFPWRIDEMAESEGGDDGGTGEQRPYPSLAEITGALAIGATICAISQMIAKAIGYESYAILFVTVITVTLATLFRKYFSRISGEELMAMLLMYFFFIVVGVDVNFANLLNAAPGMFALILFIFAGHFLLMYVAGRLFKLNYAELVIGSVACIFGPPVAAAIAVLLGWRSLVVPGVMTGILGYVLGTFIGVGLYALLS